jgi:magnesium chelatase subunit D
MSDVLSLTAPFIRGLACAALYPNLRSILVLDVSPTKLRWTASILRRMLEIVEGTPVVATTLGTTETDDVLWGGLTLPLDPVSASFVWQDGLLIGGRDQTDQKNQPQQQLVIIPNLTHLSLAATRACVMAMGTDVVHVERHGQQEHWQPRICWLGGCASDEVGQVSPHLLDRLVLRLRSSPTPKMDDAARIAELLERISSQEVRASYPGALLPDSLLNELKEAHRCQPTMTDTAAARVLDYLPTESDLHSSRREITLGRLSVANAMLEAATAVTAYHVDIAAQIMGLRRIEERPPEEQVAPAEPSELPGDESELLPAPESAPELKQRVAESAPGQVPVYEPDTAQNLPPSSLPLPSARTSPYPEDDASVEREFASLRLPTRQRGQASVGRGPVIGIEPATSLHDLALVSTIFETAKYQPIRRERDRRSGRRLLISPSDLRGYRRATVPEKLLVLVIDYTCLRDCRWEEALIPHLQWAYIERASACLVRIGAANASHELRAERLMVRNVLVPQFSAALYASPGRATPLAHGLDLAFQTLRHVLQHGRSIVLQARLVVLSDGRGNVPLEASRTGHITLPVNREGIEDALQVAAHMRGLDHLEIMFLNPQPQQHAEVPLELADALGAELTNIPLTEALLEALALPIVLPEEEVQ